MLTLSVDYKANWLCLHNVMNQLEKIMVFLNRSDTENSHNAWLVEWIFMLYHCIHYYYYIILSCSTSLNILRDIVVQAPRGFTLVRHILRYLSVASILCSWLCMVFFNVKNGIQHLVECTICNHVIHISAWHAVNGIFQM